jgi:hypothetical protein
LSTSTVSPDHGVRQMSNSATPRYGLPWIGSIRFAIDSLN